jgi:hypothetical protein
MDFWMIQRQELPRDLLGLFTALGDLQYQFDWVISDTDLYFLPDTPETVRKRWSWTGLLMDGRELTEHLTAGYVCFCVGGVFSAVPLGTQAEQVWDYVPAWEIKNFGAPDYQFQTPLTELEIICYDGSDWVVICRPEFSERIQKCLPQAKRLENFAV